MADKRYRHAPDAPINRIKEMFANGDILSAKHILLKFVQEDNLRTSPMVKPQTLYRELYQVICSRITILYRQRYIKYISNDPKDLKCKLYRICTPSERAMYLSEKESKGGASENVTDRESM